MSLISGKQNRSQKSGAAPSVASWAGSSNMSVKGETYQEKKMKALAAKNTTVMTYEELERIKGMCKQTNEQEDYQTMRMKERTDKKMISQARVSKWPNTIHAERERKEYERIKKLEDDEIERRRIDAEEEAFQQAARQNQLDKANKMFHDNQDMVKALHSKMLLCDVITEQQVQLQTKARKENLEKEINLQWEELEKQKMQEYDERLRQKLEKEYHKKMKNAKEIQDQLEDFKLNYIKKMKEEQLEGQLIKKQVEEELEREKLRDLERMKRAAKTREEFKKANEELLKIQQEIAVKEQEEELKIEEYARKKDALEHLKKTKESERFKQKQLIKQQLVDKQIAELMKVRDQEEEILNKQVAEAENKATALFEQKEIRRLEMKAAIEKSRKNQIDRTIKEAEAKKQEELEFAEFWKLRNDELAIAEQQEREEERQRRVELTNYLKKQTAEKNAKNQDAFVQDQYQALRNQSLQDQQEKNFYSYAEKCVSEWETQGKNVKPLVMELKNYKKRVLQQ